MTQKSDNQTNRDQVAMVMAIVTAEWAGQPKPPQPPIPDETLNFASGKVKPRPQS